MNNVIMKLISGLNAILASEESDKVKLQHLLGLLSMTTILLRDK